MNVGNDEQWMQHALQLAARAEAEGEVPVGAVIVDDEQCIAEAWNQPIARHDATAHAEILCIRAAGENISNYRLTGTSLYVTLEPCAMCAGAIIQARIKRVVFGAADPKSGAAGSVFNILGTDKLNHRVEVMGGVMENECADILASFFRKRRAAN